MAFLFVVDFTMSIIVLIIYVLYYKYARFLE